jgi:A/G-specific adenine glycosylase
VCRRVRRRLLAWFARHRRDLPWRRDRDAYRIWVSEIMLQQTQVATVIPYFERFVVAFPTVAVLAAATEHDVLRLWEGLGYYRRARDLRRAAQALAAEHAGAIPNDPLILGKLPGFGRYTVGAVLSQAFDRRLPILEANSQRVLSRLFGRRDDPRGGAARKWLWMAAEALLPRKQVGDFNQALMELGSLVCTPTSPRCGECPVASDCEAKRLGLQEKIPPPARQPELTDVHEAAVVVYRGDRVLLLQRPATAGRWAGLWEFPHAPLQPGEMPTTAAARLLPQLTGVTGSIGGLLLTIKHGITRYRITVDCFAARHEAGRFVAGAYADARWVLPAELESYPVSAPQRRLAAAVQKRDHPAS